MTDREIMQMALEALENPDATDMENRSIWNKAIKALRERLEQPTVKKSLQVEQPQQEQRWAVFCAGCRKEWSVPYQHPGKSVCGECEANLKERNA